MELFFTYASDIDLEFNSTNSTASYHILNSNFPSCMGNSNFTKFTSLVGLEFRQQLLTY